MVGTKKNNPLHVLDESWDELTDEQKEKLQGIENWDLSFLLGDPLKSQGFKLEEYQESAIGEMKKFLAIKILFEPEHMGMFGPMVVAAWRSFVLDTINYEKFCKLLYHKTIHHSPGHKEQKDTEVWLGLYHHLFGILPEVWKLDLDGQEILGMETKMNIQRSCDYAHLDSDDGAYDPDWPC